MNDTDDFEEREDDTDLESLLSPLKRIEPTTTAQSEFRAAVAAELANCGPLRRPQPWWQRSIQVPVPLALVATMLLLVSVSWTLRAPQVPDSPAAQPQATSPPDGTVVSMPEAVVRATSDSRLYEPEYYSTEIYLCGVGRISSVSGYTIQEPNHVP